MGTNYYLHGKECPCCGRASEPLHIGKSSAGWHFSLHIIPEKQINSLEDWKTLWESDEYHIENEYGERIEVDKMIDLITNRKGRLPHESKPYGYRSWEDFHRQNYSEDGLNGLIAHRYRAKRTNGTYDLIEGDFS